MEAIAMQWHQKGFIRSIWMSLEFNKNEWMLKKETKIMTQFVFNMKQSKTKPIATHNNWQQKGFFKLQGFIE